MVDKGKVKCETCGKSFYSRKQLQQHIQDSHKTTSRDIPVTKSIKKYFKVSNKLIAIIGVGIVVAIIAGIGVYSVIAPRPAFPLAIGGIQCNPSEQLLFHIHTHLDIIINGQYFLVPAQIGITNTCFYWLHTHDVTGIIHIESPVTRDFTLGQFFDIWSKKFSSDQIKFNNAQLFNNVVNANSSLNVYVNGIKVSHTASYRDVKLHAHDEIAIVYGTTPSVIPSSYNFPEGL